ncbi:MAG: MATE family efflux transporter [Ezakiella sp.]|nr:MATE family efflux transporter [Ezakiella sp.]
MTNPWQKNLIEGPIAKGLLKLALPLMGTSFLTMIYNLTDLYWVGTIGTEAVAAVGIGGTFWWMANSLALICNVGLAVTVSQNYGRQDIKRAKEYINSGVKLSIIIACSYAFFIGFFNKQFVTFFNIEDALTYESTITYLSTLAIGYVSLIMNPVFAVVINAEGDSRLTFKVSLIGVVTNMILDPVFILEFKWGVFGAALATTMSQILVSIIYIYLGKKYSLLYAVVDYKESWKKEDVKEILKLGVPPAAQSGVQCFITMYIARMIAGFGPAAVAAQSIGSNIEGICWLTAEGYSTANATYIGQNYGAKKYDRVNKAFFTSVGLMFMVGLFSNILLFFGRFPIIKIFLHEELAIAIGADYLKILSFSQIFSAIEIANAGAFNGISMTTPPSIIGIVGNLLRIPFAYILIGFFGINGIWMAISLSSILKGMVSFCYFLVAKEKRLNASHV